MDNKNQKATRQRRTTVDTSSGSGAPRREEVQLEEDEHGSDAPLSEATFTRALQGLKQDICGTFDSKMDTLTLTLRSEILSVKAELKANVNSIQTLVETQGATIKDLEVSATSCSDELTSLQASVCDLAEEVKQLQSKCEDLEGRSRRNNIRLIGLAEGLELPNTREFISQLLRDLLRLEEVPLLDRAHRSSREKPKEGAPPRPIIIRVHYFHVKEQILRRAGAAAPLLYQGRKIFIFPDFTSAVAKKRSQFVNAKRLLHSCPGIKFGLFYPAELRITLPDGAVRRFSDPKAATDFISKTLGVRAAD
uniref:Transposase element L1Md-A101/L1Md-A102/L1Md-A2 n=1 Tax=Knipowitschia caucasica TaxID=637954 RepID=A0AAV2KW34_KNICA